MTQQALDFLNARADGAEAAGRCADKAERVEDPEFRQKARAAILEHLRVVREASGEVLTDVAVAKGARCHDTRAFGAVFAKLARDGMIRTVGYCARTRGHGTSGGRIWALCQ
ncbi:MAG: hypothetical protein KF686_03510 [Ramlibacter sp.]|nr:hypothetical protein [Ramlibacter sp.]